VRGVANTPEAIREQQRGKHWDMVRPVSHVSNCVSIAGPCVFTLHIHLSARSFLATSPLFGTNPSLHTSAAEPLHQHSHIFLRRSVCLPWLDIGPWRALTIL
jgi:hypothetical protein